MSRSYRRVGVTFLTLFTSTAPLAFAQSATATQAREQALQRLKNSTGAEVVASEHKATGAARFVRVPGGSARGLGDGPAATPQQKEQQSRAFFRDHGALVGVTDPMSMRLVASTTDALGETHLTWQQFYGAVPVFAGTMKTHFDRSNRLKAVTGTSIPDIVLDPAPSFTSAQAGQSARTAVVAERGDSDALRVGRTTLYVYREGLAQGVPGPNHLAWEVEVTDGAGIRDMVYIGAHSGKVIDRVSAVHDELYRRAYDGRNLPSVPANYPNGAYWLEGQRFPVASQEANNMIVASKEVYDFFRKTFGRDSFDGKGAAMDAIFDRGYSCPNASWNGVFISFCPGFTTDDVTVHEWAHAYTQYTNGLIYQWQPGALNESYSDIWGEVIDQINNRGNDAPGTARTDSCSTFSPPTIRLTVNTPAAIAGTYFANAAQFGPTLTSALSGDVVAALDAGDPATGANLDGCTALTNAGAVAGKIALINRGTCEFGLKVLNAQQAGAAAAIIVDNAASGLILMGPGAVGSQVTIPSISVQQATGTAIRNQLAVSATVNVTIGPKPGTDASYRWLMGEEITEGGALRDMWNPTCYSNPGKVSDPFYLCSTADNGGVHINSGVPNHGFALLVDGGAYNGRNVAAIGLTKAAHIYYRAQTVYHTYDSDFGDHADALEQSCTDLTGKPLTALNGGASTEQISASDCAQVTSMIAAVELRASTAFCNFAPLLDPRTAPTCGGGTTGVTQSIASFTFESDPFETAPAWSFGRTGTAAGFTDRDWTWVNSLPSGRAGSGLFAPDPNIGSCTTQDESGVLHLTSPEIVVPAGADFARATFEHWVATEPGWDGGNLSVSVNGGAWQLVPPSQFTFNGYPFVLFSAEQGNTNPLAGQPAWTGNNNGTVNGGSWGRTHVNLGNFAGPGDTVQLRWNLGTDGCAGRTGWYLDNVNVFSCTPVTPSISVADVSVTEGNAGEKQLAFTVRLSGFSIKPVSVDFEVVDGSAQHGNDFDPVSGTAVIPATTATVGFNSTTILVNIKGDIVPEGNETLRLRLRNPTNATLTGGVLELFATGTIVDDDKTPPGPPGN